MVLRALKRRPRAALALGLLAAYLAILGRGVAAVFVAAALVSFLLLVPATSTGPTAA